MASGGSNEAPSRGNSLNGTFARTGAASRTVLPPFESLKVSPPTITSPSHAYSQKSDSSRGNGSGLAPLPHLHPSAAKHPSPPTPNSKLSGPIDFKKPAHLSPRYSSSESSTSSGRTSAGATYFPDRPAPASAPAPAPRHEAGLEALLKKPAFEASELKHHDLPEWDTLDRILDYYYRNNHINDQLLTNREIFLSRISLNNDASILHAIIATVCLSNEQYVRNDEDYWIGKVSKYWDDLNDFGMLLCYSLIAKTSHIRHNPQKFVDITVKIYDIISYNRYLDIFQNNLRLNNRQVYERELVIRMIWNYWAYHLVRFRFNQGSPFISDNNPKLAFDIDNYYRSLMLPLSNEDHLQLTNFDSRISWENLTDPAHAKFDDASSMIYSVKLLEDVLNKVAKNDLVSSSNEMDSIFFDYIESNLFIKKGDGLTSDNDKLIINSSILMSNFVSKLSIIIQNSCILKDILAFKPFDHSPKQPSDKIELLNDISMNDILNLEDLPKSLLNLSQDQLQKLMDLYKNTIDLVSLIEIGEGKLPNDSNNYAIVMGVTETGDANNHYHNKQQWWKDKTLTTRGRDTWAKFPGFSLDAACSLMSVLPSLMVLTKFLKVVPRNQDVEVTIIKPVGVKTEGMSTTDPNKTVVLKNSSSLDESYFKLFESSELLKRFNNVVSFIQYKLQVGKNNNDLMNDSISKINKRSHYLEEILNNIN